MIRYKRIKTVLSLTVILVMPFILVAQKTTVENLRYRYIEVRAHTGFHAYTGSDDLKPFLESGYGALELKFGWQPHGEDHWAAQYGYPSYGFGLYAGFVGSPQVFGDPSAVFGFAKFHLSKDEKRNIFSIEPALGLTYNLEPYDPDTNPLNNAIGARMAVYFNLKFGWTYKWSREMDITYGFDVTHMSNGRSFTPNYGLNMMGLHLGLSYNYNPDQNKYKKDLYDSSDLLPVRYKRPKRKKVTKYTNDNNFINIYNAIGTVQSYADQGTDIRFTAYSLVLDYQHKFNTIHSISAGLDYFFDGSLIEDFPDDPSKRYHLGAHVGYDFMFHKVTILGHLGFYLNENETKPPIYFRPAIRYNFNNWLYGQIGLKARGFAADWVEFGIGVRPFKW